MIVDTKDIEGQKNKDLKKALGNEIFEMFDIWLTYDEDITHCIGVSFQKHCSMNTLQNFRLNDQRHQSKVKALEFPDIVSHNKWTCPADKQNDLLEDIQEAPLKTQDLISHYYCKRSTFLRKNHKKEEQASVRISPNRLSTIYKLAETINFLRTLYIKPQDSSDEDLDLIDGILAIFFNELTALSDKSIRFSDKQLLRSYCIERVLSRMEVRPFHELGKCPSPTKSGLIHNLGKKHIPADFDCVTSQKWTSCDNCTGEGEVPLLVADFPATYIGLIKSIFWG